MIPKKKMKFFLKKEIFRMLLIIVSLSTISTLSSCKKESKNDIGTNDNYNVKYAIMGNGPYGHFSDWTAAMPQGTYSNNGYQTRSWNQTYGPVKRGFKCEVQIGKYIGGEPTIEIHVSKNQEPFVLKVTKKGSSAFYFIY